MKSVTDHFRDPLERESDPEQKLLLLDLRERACHLERILKNAEEIPLDGGWQGADVVGTRAQIEQAVFGLADAGVANLRRKHSPSSSVQARYLRLGLTTAFHWTTPLTIETATSEHDGVQ